MSHQEQKNITSDEIKKEFQLERMILFSDAVFAIVITLMAIEIKLPESEGISVELLPEILKKLAPNFIAYCVSFIFIGAIWYNHLNMFSLLKDYDKGLVVRNLFLLFFVSLFPFNATLVSRVKGASLPFFMYLGIILLCILSQYILYHYILIKRPELRVKSKIENHFWELYKRKISLIGFSIASALMILTHYLIADPINKPLAMFWIVLFPIIYKFNTRRKKRH
jgi:uncharacterized membrane protein